VEDKTLPKPIPEPAEAIRQVDAHIVDANVLFTCYSSYPTLGLDLTAVERKAADGKNIISRPLTQYWKKLLNYIFGGLNFLMWIAFIVTVVCRTLVSCHWYSCIRISSPTNPWAATILPPSTWCCCPLGALLISHLGITLIKSNRFQSLSYLQPSMR
jgi:hypothetical protein